MKKKIIITTIIASALLAITTITSKGYQMNRYAGETEINYDTPCKIPIYDINLSQDLQEYIFYKTRKVDISPELILALLHLESRFDPHLVHKNSNGTMDRGIAQINSAYQDWYAEIAEIKNFNSFNPKDGIKACIAAIDYLRDYWIARGLTDRQNLTLAVLNSYNMGIGGYTNYVKKTGNLSRAYDKTVLSRKYQLEQYGRIK